MLRNLGKKILFCLPLLLLALQSCEIEDEYMYDKGLYTIDWDAAADSSSVTLIDRFWNTEENYFNYGNDGSIKDFHYWPQAHAMDVMIDAYNRTGDSKYSDLFDNGMSVSRQRTVAVIGTTFMMIWSGLLSP